MASSRHDVSRFSCGEPTLDAWLREQAPPATKRGTARTWVWVDDEAHVVGYFGFRRVPGSLALSRGSPTSRQHSGPREVESPACLSAVSGSVA